MCCLEEVYKCLRCDRCSVVNVYLVHLKFCVLMVECMSVVVNVMLSLISVLSTPHALCNLSARTMVKLCTVCVFALGVSLVFRIGMISMHVVNKQFELLEFIFDSAYVDLQYDENSLTFTTGSVSLFCVCSHMVVFSLSVRLSWCPIWMRWLLL